MKNMKEMIEYPTEGILSKDVLRDDKVNATLFCMAAGTEMSEHTSVKQGFVYVIEGNGIFTLEGEEIEMKPNVFIALNKNAKHSLSAKENTSFMLVLS